MTDIMSAEKRRRLMSRIRSKDTTPERYIRDLLVAAGLTFTKHDAGLPGSPDFVFPRQKLVVFVHGDFWHGWRFPVWQHRMNQFWREKIARNRARDKRNTRLLRQRGWKVVRIWEHQVECNALECVRRVVEHLGLRWSASRKLAVQRRLTELPPLRRRPRLPRP